jgi:Holliday junction resolvase
VDILSVGFGIVSSGNSSSGRTMVNPQVKGKTAEREVVDLLTGNVILVMRELGFSAEAITKAASSIQRNQNQSAVGGSDLTNVFGLSIEVKRQEQLSINTWWKQTVDAAVRNNEHPVLIFRQNHKKWRVMTYCAFRLPGEGAQCYYRAEMEYIDFQSWFREWVKVKLRTGHEIRV